MPGDYFVLGVAMKNYNGQSQYIKKGYRLKSRVDLLVIAGPVITLKENFEIMLRLLCAEEECLNSKDPGVVVRMQ